MSLCSRSPLDALLTRLSNESLRLDLIDFTEYEQSIGLLEENEHFLKAT